MKINMLPSTQKLVQCLRKQMGDYAFVRYCRNLGIDFEDCYFLMFGKMPKVIFPASGADLRGASLGNADFSRVKLSNADFTRESK